MVLEEPGYRNCLLPDPVARSSETVAPPEQPRFNIDPVTLAKINQATSILVKTFQCQESLRPVFQNLRPKNITSNLEGQKNSVASGDLLNKLGEFQSNLPDSEKILIQNAQEKVKFSHEIAEVITRSGLAKVSKLAQCNEKIQKKLDELSPGENFILQLGYNEVIKGHHILGKIQKEQNGTFTFSLYNSGEGSHRHTGIQKNNKNFVGTLDFQNLSRDSLNENFFNQLFNLQLPDFENHDNSVDKFYDLFFKTFQQTNSKGEALNIGSSQIHAEQAGGVCTSKPLSAWLHGELTDNKKKAERSPKKELLYLKFRKFGLEKDKKEINSKKYKEAIEISAIKTNKKFLEVMKKNSRTYRIFQNALTHLRKMRWQIGSFLSRFERLEKYFRTPAPPIHDEPISTPTNDVLVKSYKQKLKLFNAEFDNKINTLNRKIALLENNSKES